MSFGNHKHGINCPCKYISTNLSSLTAAEFGVLSKKHISSIVSSINRNPCISSISSPSLLSNNVPSSRYTPLHLAAQNNNVESTLLLLNSYKKTNAWNDSIRIGNLVDGIPKSQGGCGATPLHRASFSGAYECMAHLIHHGANLLAQDESFGDLMTPLHKAASGGRYRAVELLLISLSSKKDCKNGGDGKDDHNVKRALQMQDSKGRTVLQLCQSFVYDLDYKTERQSVARWNKVAGGEPDWRKCLFLLEQILLKMGLDSGNNGLGMVSPYCMICADQNRTIPNSSDSSISSSISNTSFSLPTHSLPAPHQQETTMNETNQNIPNKIYTSPSLKGQMCASCGKSCLVLRRSRKDKTKLICRACSKLKY